MSREIPDELPPTHNVIQPIAPLPHLEDVRDSIRIALDPVLQPLYRALHTAYYTYNRLNLFRFDDFWRDFTKHEHISYYIKLSQNSKKWSKGQEVDEGKLVLFADLLGELFGEFLGKYLIFAAHNFQGGLDTRVYQRFLDLFSDMTQGDTENWSEFMKRKLQEMRSEQVELGFKIYDLQGGYVLEESKFTPPDGMEGYRELQFEFQCGSGEKASLPTVRYGIYGGGKKAVIYCLQNEGFGLSKMSYESLKTKLEFIERRKSGTYAKAIASGKMRKDLTLEEMEPLFQYYRGVKEDLQLSDEFFFGFYDFILDWKEEDSYLADLAIAEKERAVIGEMTKSLRKGLKSGDGIRSVPGGSLVSLALAVKRLHEVGVREIAIPLILPTRLHWHRSKSGLDERIFNSKLAVARRLAYEFDGVEMAAGNFEFDIEKLAEEERCGDDYVVLRLGDEIKPRREPVKEFFGEAFAA